MSIASVSGRKRAERKVAAMQRNTAPYRITCLADGTWLVIQRGNPEQEVCAVGTYQEALEVEEMLK